MRHVSKSALQQQLARQTRSLGDASHSRDKYVTSSGSAHDVASLRIRVAGAGDGRTREDANGPAHGRGSGPGPSQGQVARRDRVLSEPALSQRSRYDSESQPGSRGSDSESRGDLTPTAPPLQPSDAADAVSAGREGSSRRGHGDGQSVGARSTGGSGPRRGTSRWRERADSTGSGSAVGLPVDGPAGRSGAQSHSVPHSPRSVRDERDDIALRGNAQHAVVGGVGAGAGVRRSTAKSESGPQDGSSSAGGGSGVAS